MTIQLPEYELESDEIIEVSINRQHQTLIIRTKSDRRAIIEHIQDKKAFRALARQLVNQITEGD